jgi:phenylalanyl-tRNA synthetase beta chain
MPGGFAIKDSKLRGERSSGMMCSAKELELPGDPEGLMILDPATAPGLPLKSLFQGDTVLELEVTPNRADLLSVRGIARELAALGATLRPAPVTPALPAAPGPWQVELETPEDCPRYACLLLEGASVGPSPDWLRARLESIGLRPVNNVVDITNFVLFETGQPLHAFDADRLSGTTIRVRRATGGESFPALNGKTYPLTPDDLVIADANGPVALAGIMGGASSGVTGATTRILLESARFHPGRIRRTSRRLQLLSDSSHRFERGIDPAAVDLALARAAGLITELCGARVTGGPTQSAPASIPTRTLGLSPSLVRRVLGFEVAPERITAILTGLGLLPTAEGSWRIPSHRPDLEREIDLIEEIARIEGMDRAPARVPGGVAPRGAADRAHDLERALKDHLVALGFHEMSSNSLLPAETDLGPDAIRILNPLNADNAWIRPTLISALLPAVRHNTGHGVSDIRGFEIGAASRTTGGLPAEQRRLALLWSGAERPAHWTEPGRPADGFSLRGLVDQLRTRFPALPEPECLGAIPPAVRKAHGIKVPVFAAEFILPTDWTPAPAAFQPLPAFPAVKRDLSFVVESAVTQECLRRAILGAGVRELESAECFDLFHDPSGAKLPADRKALAYALTYRSPERTLTEKDVAAWEQTIVTAVERETGGRLRQ